MDEMHPSICAVERKARTTFITDALRGVWYNVCITVY